MAEGDMLLFPGLKTGYQNSSILLSLSGLHQKHSTHKRQETYSQETKQLSESDSDMTHLLELADTELKVNMFKILKTLKKMTSNMKDQMNNFSEMEPIEKNEVKMPQMKNWWQKKNTSGGAHLSIDSL